VLSVIDRYRERGLPAPISLDVLTRTGITDSLAPRTLQALKLLDLITEDGNPTATLETLRRAPSADFQARMQDFVRTAYAEVLSYVDPAKDSLEQMRDAFRPYVPHGQQVRMLSLFVGLVEAAGMREPAVNGGGEPVSRRPPVRRGGRAVPARPPRKGVSNGGNGNGQVPQHESTTPPPNPPSPHVDPPILQGGRADTTVALPAAIVELLKTSLPGGSVKWTQVQQDRFLTAFAAVIKLLYPVDE